MLSSASHRNGGQDAGTTSEIIADRRVRLVAQYGDYYTVTMEVRGPRGWEDIGLHADQI